MAQTTGNIQVTGGVPWEWASRLLGIGGILPPRLCHSDRNGIPAGDAGDPGMESPQGMAQRSHGREPVERGKRKKHPEPPQGGGTSWGISSHE